MDRRDFIKGATAAPLAAVPFLPNKIENPNNFPVVQFGELSDIMVAGGYCKMSPVLNAKEIFDNVAWEGTFKFAHAWVNECDAVYDTGPGGLYPASVMWGELRLSLCPSGAIYFNSVESAGGKIENAHTKTVRRAYGYYPDPNGEKPTQLIFEDCPAYKWSDSDLPIIKIGLSHFPKAIPNVKSIENAKEIFKGIEWKKDNPYHRGKKTCRAILKSQDAIIRENRVVWGEVYLTLYSGGAIYIDPTEKSVRTTYFSGHTMNRDMKDESI